MQFLASIYSSEYESHSIISVVVKPVFGWNDHNQ